MKETVRRFNLLDWVILTVLAAALAFAGFLIWRRERTAPPELPIVCVFRLPASEKPAGIRVGDPVRNENGTVLFGYVTDVAERPQKLFGMRNGSPVYETVNGTTVTEFTVRMSAVRGIDYRVGDIRVCAGESGNYRVGPAFCAGVVTVSVAEEVLP